MRSSLFKALSLTFALAVLVTLVVHAGITGCAKEQTATAPALPDSSARAPTPSASSAPPAAAVTSAPPAQDLTNQGFLPASKAGPVWHPPKDAPSGTPK